MAKIEYRYLVAVRDFVVAQDIAATISDLHPGAEVLSARSIDEAGDMVTARGGVRVAVTDAKPIRLNGSPTGGILAACGARILFIGARPPATDADPADAPTIFLDPPFTTAALVDALRAVDGQPQSRVP